MRGVGFTYVEIAAFLKQQGIRGRTGMPLPPTRVFELAQLPKKRPELENVPLGVRIRAAIDALPVRGGALKGEAPWGFRYADDRKCFVAEESERRVSAVIVRKHDEGLTLQQIADHLRELGVAGRKGNPLSRMRVWQILRQETRRA